VRILIPLPQDGSRLSRAFQVYLNAAILVAAEEMRRDPLPLLYTIPHERLKYQAEPWSGSGVEEFADPWTVYRRGWGDCDDLVIYRAAELLVRGYPVHALIRHETANDKYHTQVRREFDGLIEDPSLERLGRPCLFPPY
jgi:hypothetical protein